MSAGENEPEGKSSWKSRWAEKPRWLRLAVKIALIAVSGVFVLAVLSSFPFVRAAGYPVVSVVAGKDVNISEYCPVYTSDEKPGFLIRSSSHLFYDVKVYRNSPALPQETFPARHDVEPSNIPNLARFPSSYSAQGFITPRDLFVAESRVDLPVLPVGDYLATIKTSPLFLGEPATRWIRFKVTDLGAIIKHDDSKVLITTFNLRTRKPWPNADIVLDSDAEEPMKGRTDERGIAEFQRPSATNDWNDLNIDIKSGANTAYLGSYENQYEMHHCNDGYLDIQGNFNSYNRRFRTFFQQDKPLYRLGQTIQIRALTRKVTDSGIVNPGSGVQARVKIYDANYKEIKNTTLSSDQYGGFSIKLAPAEYSATGQYRVELRYPNNQNDTCTFQVDQYRKPEFKVDIVPEKQRFVSGQPVKVRIKANYYFGAPVANTKMKYTVQAHADDASKNELNEEKGSSRFFDNWQTSDNYYFYGASARPAVSGEITTNEAGEAFLTVDSKETPLTESNPYSYRYFDESFTISVEATDLSRKTVTAEGNASMSRGDFAVFAKPKRSVVKVGEKLDVDLSVIAYDRKPVAEQELKINLVRWKMKDPMKGTWEVVPVADAIATTDDTGKGSVSFAIDDKSPSDQYYVVAETKDKGGRTVGNVGQIWVIGQRTDSWLEHDQERQFLKVTPDKPSYAPGEIARVVVSAPVPNEEEAYLLVSLEGASLHSYKLLNMKGPAAYAEFPVEGKFVPNAYISAAFVGKNHHPRQASSILKVAPEKQFLSCTVSSDKPRYRPGETARFTVQAKEPDGTPAANVQLCASVVDEGLFAIYENLKRQTYMYEQGKADIFNAIFSLVDNEVETRFTFTDSHQVRVPEHPFFDGAGIALISGWFGRSAIYEDAVMCKAGAPMLQGATNGTIGAQMMDAAAPAAMPAPRAEMSAESGAAPPRRGRSAPEPRVRSNFLDSIGWFPTLLTDSGGAATFSVKLPDDLTTWRTTVNGVSLQSQLASAQSTTLSTQDFLARLALPRFYTEGDEASVAGLIHNLSGKVQDVTVSVATSGNLKLNEPATKQIRLERDEVKRVSWNVTAGKTGTAEVILKAVGGTTSDAEKRTLPINAYGYRVYFAKNGVLKNPSDTAKFPLVIPPEAKLDNGQLALSMSSSAIGPVLGNFEKLIEYPYGCTEQTLSRLIPSVVSMRLARDLQIEVTPEVRAKHAKVYDIAMPKLTDYHHPDGGWGWWKEDRSDPYMTAHVIEGLYLLRKAGFSVDQSLIDSGLSFLQTQVSALAGQTWNLDPATDQAKSIYVLSLFDRSPNPAEKLWQMAKLSKAPPEALAYLTIAFKNKGDKVAAQQAYNRLKSLANESLEYTSWDHTKPMLEKMGLKNIWDYTYRFSDVETTALALRAVAVMEPENSELLERITRWLILERDEDGWGNTKSTSAVFLALLEKELATKPNRTTNFKAKIDAASALITEIAFNKTFERREERVIVPLKNRPDSATISKTGPGWLYYSSLLEYDRPLKSGEQPLLKSIPSDLKVQEDFFRLVAPAPGQAAKTVAAQTQAATTYKLEEMGEKPLAPGDIVMMRVVVDAPFAIPYAMVEAALPSGGEVLRTPPSVDQKLPGQKNDKTGAVEETAWFWWTHQDILDDRIAFFSSSLPAGKNEFRAFIRVEMPGKFNINPVTMEAMYTDKVHARSTAHTIVVKE